MAVACDLPAETFRLMYGDTALRGACADGKTFIARVAVDSGHVWYFRGDTWVGSASYTAQIGDCACSGESWSGDVRCAEPTYETLCGQFDEPTLSLPFADGKRVAPCLCAD
jgi:hypothetical protein